MSTKGSAINFIGGKYNGRSGWLVAGKAASVKQVHVIVDMGHGLKVTRVSKENVNIASQQLTSQPTLKSSPERKGYEIVFIGGKYKGHTGWRNTAKQETDQCVHVIVNLGEELLETLVYKRSIQNLKDCNEKLLQNINAQREDTRKGSPVRFVGGKYKGKSGWLHGLGETGRKV